MTPSVHIDPPPGPLFIGFSATYTATSSDPDGDSYTTFWQNMQQAQGSSFCTPPANISSPASWPQTGWTPGPSLTLQAAETYVPFCVWVKAVDSWGAASADALLVNPQDQAQPVAALSLVSPPSAPSFPTHTLFELSAEGSKDSEPGKVPSFAWSLKWPTSTTVKLGACADAPDNNARQCFTADAAGEYEVEVVVTDGAKQTSTADMWLNVRAGQVGVANVNLISPSGPGPYPLGSTFQVSGAQSTADGQMVSYTWTDVQRPDGTKVPAQQCSDAASVCFTADIPGSYQIGLTVTDDAGTSPTTWAMFDVAADQPPCIDQTTPDFTQAMTTDSMFVVNVVSDDLDPYPPTADMQWFVSTDGATYVPVESDFPSYSINPAAYSPTDTVHVRVEVHDRDTQRSQREFDACGNKADFCSETSAIHPDTCFQRVTWTVQILR
jgi:hypothetical protein